MKENKTVNHVPPFHCIVLDQNYGNGITSFKRFGFALKLNDKMNFGIKRRMKMTSLS